MAYLNLRLFGGFEATFPSGGSVPLPTKKAKALLAYCALRPGQAHERDTLAALFWGDTSDANARNALRQTLFVLRRALQEAWPATLGIEGDTIATRPPAIDVDVLRFERLALDQTPPALAEAAALYRGDLLEGFVVDEDPFEQWLLGERERLRDLALEVLARLLRHQDAVGLTGPAVQTARRLLVLDPLQEAVHRVLMRLYAQAGRREAAMRQYEVLVGLLKRELRLEPEPETHKLYEMIRAGRWPGPAASPRFIPGKGARRMENAGVAGAAEGTARAPNGAGSHAEDPHGRRPITSFPPPAWAEYQARVDQARIQQQKARELKRKAGEVRVFLRTAVRKTTETVADLRTLMEGDGRLGSPSTEGGPVSRGSDAGSD
jgi:DNA-binding SARP family transcriptional activator